MSGYDVFKLHVSGIPVSMTQDDLQIAAKQFGKLLQIKWFQKYAFLTYDNDKSCLAAIRGLQRYKLSVSYAHASNARARDVNYPRPHPLTSSTPVPNPPINQEPQRGMDQSMTVALRNELAKSFSTAPQYTSLAPYTGAIDNKTPQIDVEDLLCVNCQRYTENCCPRCQYPFCNRQCLFKARKLHVSFCGFELKKRSSNPVSFVLPDSNTMEICAPPTPRIGTARTSTECQSLNVSDDDIDSILGRSSPPPKNQSSPIQSTTSSVKSANKMEITVEKQQEPELQLVLFCVQGDGGYWVTPHLTESYTKIESTLVGAKLPRISKPAIGDLCIAPYDNVLYRARIIAVAPKIQVHFMDFGNDDYCEATELMEMPNSIRNIPEQAIFGRLSEKDSLRKDAKKLLNTFFTVKLDRSNPKEAVIELILPFCDAGRPLENFRNNTEVIVTSFDETGAVILMRPDLREIYAKLAERIKLAAFSSNTPVKVPSEGDLIGAWSSSKKQFMRARVIQSEEASAFVEFIDEGIQATVELCGIRCIQDDPTPPGALRIWPKLQRLLKNILEMKNFWEKLIKNETRLTLLYTENPICDAMLMYNGACCSILSADMADDGIEVEKDFPSGAHVAIRFVHGPAQVSISNLDPKIVEKYTKLQNDICESFLFGPLLTSLPEIDAIVGAFWPDDENHYRARILAHVENKALVQFVDYGKITYIDLGNLRLIPDTVDVSLPNAAIKVRIRGVPQNELYFPYYLKTLKENNDELELKYDGKLEDGVDLIDVHRNIKINEFAKSSDLTKDDALPYFERIYLADGLSQIKMDEGIKRLYILSCDDFEEHGIISVTELENETVAFVMGTLLDALQKSCEESVRDAYRPRIDELCMVFFTGVWLRAKCNDFFNVEHVVLFLIDCGRIIFSDTANIRPMPTFAIGIPATACICSVQGFEKITPENRELVLHELKEGQQVTAYVAVTKKGYIVNIPAVEFIVQ